MYDVSNNAGIPARLSLKPTVLSLVLLFAGCGGAVLAPDDDADLLDVDLSAVLHVDLRSPDAYAHPAFPAHYDAGVLATVNTPAANPVTDRGVLLGRVLFYDEKLSLNETVSCATCHVQQSGFTDPERFSAGFQGGLTTSHSMRLGNSVFYEGDVMFWDKRAHDLEDQSLQPVMDAVEMGFDETAGGLDAVVARLEATDYHPVLFEWAFGSPGITESRMRRALAQFIRSMVSTGSRFDDGVVSIGGLVPGGATRLPNFTEQENLGLSLFLEPPDRGGAGCAGCHRPPAMALDPGSRSNGLDTGETVVFKAPSLKSVAAAPGFMHDGRFQTLEEVVEHYSTGVQDGPALDRRLRGTDGSPLRLDLTAAEKAALVAFLETLTDTAFLSDPRFGDPFVRS